MLFEMQFFLNGSLDAAIQLQRENLKSWKTVKFFL
jgi:hypothetical protein